MADRILALDIGEKRIGVATADIAAPLPRNQNGERTKQTDRVEKIAALLNIPATIPVYWQDESLTSVKAEEELEKRKKPYKKAAVDALAATYILNDYIAANRASLAAAP